MAYRDDLQAALARANAAEARAEAAEKPRDFALVAAGRLLSDDELQAVVNVMTRLIAARTAPKIPPTPPKAPSNFLVGILFIFLLGAGGILFTHCIGEAITQRNAATDGGH
jgi:hypothetical protein